MRLGLVTLLVVAACSSSHSGGTDIDAPAGADSATDSPAPAAKPRDRLLGTYPDWLKQHPGATTNGVDGAQLTDVCSLWTRLQPAAKAVFVTLTARMEGSHLARDGSTILDHVTKLYWLT